MVRLAFLRDSHHGYLLAIYQERFLKMFAHKKPIVLGVFLKCKAQILFFFRSAVLFNSQPLVQKVIVEQLLSYYLKLQC